MSSREQMLILFPYTKEEQEKCNKKLKLQDHVFQLNDEISLKHIISGPAYRDMQPRLLPGIGKINKEIIFNELTAKFMDYFSGSAPLTENDFDRFHEGCCCMLVEKMYSMGLNCFQYGQAQKLVNMSFKQFYCFDDAKDKESYFQYCHIPIDSRILDYFCQPSFGERFSVTTPWSKMDKNTYLTFQNAMRSFLKSDENRKFRHRDGSSFTPLELDFYIWAQNTLLDICKGMVNQAKLYKDFTGWRIYDTEKMSALKDTLQEMQALAAGLIENICHNSD